MTTTETLLAFAGLSTLLFMLGIVCFFFLKWVRYIYARILVSNFDTYSNVVESHNLHKATKKMSKKDFDGFVEEFKNLCKKYGIYHLLYKN